MKRILAWLFLWIIISWGYTLYSLPSDYSSVHVEAVMLNKIDFPVLNQTPEMLKPVPNWIARKPVDENNKKDDWDNSIIEFLEEKNYEKTLFAIDKWVNSLPQSDLYSYRAHINNPTVFPANGANIKLFVENLSQKILRKSEIAKDVLGSELEVKSVLAYQIRCYADIYRWLQALGVQYQVERPSGSFFWNEVYFDVRMKLLSRLLNYLNSYNDLMESHEKEEIKRLVSFIELEISIDDMFNERDFSMASHADGVVLLEGKFDENDKSFKTRLATELAIRIPEKFKEVLKINSEKNRQLIEEWKSDKKLAQSRFDKKKKSLLKDNTLKLTGKTLASIFWAPLILDTAAEALSFMLFDSFPSAERIFVFYSELDDLKKSLVNFSN